MKKEISILTFWGVPNYGAFAQAYALNSILRTMQTEYSVNHIGYLHPEHKKLYFEKRPPRLKRMRTILNPRYYWMWIKYLKNKKIEYPHFTADWDKIPHEVIETEKELEEKEWDIIFTGSDAIWEYSVKAFGDDIHLIGNNLNCHRLYAYAASFGDMDLKSDFPNFVGQGLSNYHKISVRDEMSGKIVKHFTGAAPEIVLDPTLLWNFKEDSNIPKPMYENYILVYGREFSDEMIKEIQEYARAHQLQIIGAGLAPEWCDLKLKDIGPLEWIGMFAKAEFVVTCTFHGLMFSINYNKKVLFNQVKYVANRSETLLLDLGLSKLYHENVTLKKILDYPWNYEEINKKLNAMRNDSRAVIEEMLHEN